jgi:hypothetical protein
MPLLERWSLTLHRCGPLPSEVHAAMISSGATLGADRAGRVWYGEAGSRAVVDALVTLTLLLGILSDDDRPLSEVLDADTAGH